jgi:hypothetical protein
MSGLLMVDPIQQFFGDDRLPLAHGLVYTYSAGTSTPLATYSDAALAVPNANPVGLDALGKAVIYLGPGNYKIDVQSALGVSIDGYPRDNVAGSPWVQTGFGTSGQILTSGGNGVVPAFATLKVSPAYLAKTANYNAVAGDVVSCTGTFTVTLPLAAANPNLMIWVVNNGVGTITVSPSGADTVGLNTSQTCYPGTASQQGDALAFISNGLANWMIV